MAYKKLSCLKFRKLALTQMMRRLHLHGVNALTFCPNSLIFELFHFWGFDKSKKRGVYLKYTTLA